MSILVPILVPGTSQDIGRRSLKGDQPGSRSRVDGRPWSAKQPYVPTPHRPVSPTKRPHPGGRLFSRQVVNASRTLVDAVWALAILLESDLIAVLCVCRRSCHEELNPLGGIENDDLAPVTVGPPAEHRCVDRRGHVVVAAAPRPSQSHRHFGLVRRGHEDVLDLSFVVPGTSQDKSSVHPGAGYLTGQRVCDPPIIRSGRKCATCRQVAPSRLIR